MEGRKGEGTLGLRQDHSGDPVCGRPSMSHRIYVYMYSFILYIFLNIYIIYILYTGSNVAGEGTGQPRWCYRCHADSRDLSGMDGLDLLHEVALLGSLPCSCSGDRS